MSVQFPAACGRLYGDAILGGHAGSEGGGAVGRVDTIIEACWEDALLFKRARRIPYKREEELVCLLSVFYRSGSSREHPNRFQTWERGEDPDPALVVVQILSSLP